MEQRQIEPIDDRDLPTNGCRTAAMIRLTRTERAIEVAATAILTQHVLLGLDEIFAIRCRLGSSRVVVAFLRIQALEIEAAVLLEFGGVGGGVAAAELGDGEDGFPAGGAVGGGGVRGGVAEAGGGEGALSPAVIDAGEVPVDFVGGGVAVELVADVDEVLDRGDVDVVDGGEVEDDGFEGWEADFVVGDGDGAAAGAGVVPGAILWGGGGVSGCFWGVVSGRG